MVTPREKFIVRVAQQKNADGKMEDIPTALIIHSSKNLGDLSRGTNEVGFQAFAKYLISEVGGIDMIKEMGFNSFQVLVAECFDPAEVREAIGESLNIWLSDIKLV